MLSKNQVVTHQFERVDLSSLPYVQSFVFIVEFRTNDLYESHVGN